MQLPHIHINGTSAKSLCDQYADAWGAVDVALDKLREIETHGRDYAETVRPERIYTISSDAVNVAVAEHRERMAKLESVKADLAALAEHCHKSMKG